LRDAVSIHDKGTRFDDLVALFQACFLMKRLGDKPLGKHMPPACFWSYCNCKQI